MNGEPPQDNPPTGPLADRLVDKVWKWRLAAYEELNRLFQTADDGKAKVFTTYDSNAVSLETGLEAILTYVDRCDAAPKIANQLCPLLIDKCLGARPKTKQRATEIMLLFIEIDCGAAVIEALLQKGVLNKVPKVAAASINILTQSLKIFGKVIPFKALLSAFPAWFSHRDQAVREEAFALVTELQRWVGAAVEPKLEELTPVQAKELRERFTQSQGPAVPQKYTRSQQDKALMAASAPEPEEADPFEFMEEVDVISKLPSSWFDKLQEKKWQDRKEAMKELLDLLASPRYKNGDYHNIQIALRKVIASDINIMVVQDAIEAVGKLCFGLRKGFAKEAKELAGTLLGRFKEKKPTVVAALHVTMLNLARCVNVPDDITEELAEAAANKVPAVREQLWVWLVECLKQPKLWLKQFKTMKQFGALLVAALDDPTPAVRNGASECFGRLAGVVGERTLAPYLAKLDETRAKKVREHIPTAPVPMMESTPIEVAPQPEPVRAPEPAKTADIPKATKPQPAAKLTRPKASSQPAKSESKTEKPATQPAKSKAKQSSGPSMEITNTITFEEATMRATELLGEATVAQLASSVWKDRLAAMEQISTLVGQWSAEQSTENCEIVVRQLEFKPSLKDSNLQVLHLVLSVMDEVCKKSSSVSTGVAHSILPGVADKLPEAKTKTAGSNLLSTLATKIAPQFVFVHLYEIGTATKNQKVPAAILGWMKSLLEEYEFNVSPIELVNFLKIWLNGANIPAKNVALEIVLLLRCILGADIMHQFADLKSALLDSIKKKIDALPSLDPPQGRKKFAGSSASAGSASLGELPREDISKEISADILAKLDAKKTWQVKQEAIESIRGIIASAGKRILPNGLQNLFAAVKGRLDDSNQNIVKFSIDLLGELAEALGPEGSLEHAKVVVPALMAKYSYIKPQIRDAALQAIEVWTTQVGPLQIIPHIPVALAAENSASRKECLTWCTKHLESVKLKKAEALPLVKPVLLCLEDKTPEVRHASELVLKPLMQAVGFDLVNKTTSELKPASLRTVMPVLERIRGVVATEKKPAVQKTLAAPNPAAEPTPVAKVVAPANPNALFFGEPGASKAARLAEDMGEMKFAFAGADHKSRAEAKRILGTAMKPYIAGPILSKMFNPNGPERAEVARTLAEHCRNKTFTQEMAGAADLLLKWVSIQIFEEDTEAVVLGSIFDFLEAFINLLVSVQYQLADGESLVLLPFLVEMMGRAPAPICKRIQNDLKLITTIYPASKVFKFVLEGIKSENSGAAFCMEALESLVNRHGGMAMLQPSVLLLLAKHLGNDSLRPAALNTLAAAHLHLQGKLWTSLGNIPPSHLQLLQQHVASYSRKLESTGTVVVAPQGQEKTENPTKRRMRKCIGILAQGHSDEAGYIETLKQVCLALDSDPAACLESASEIVSILTPAVGSALGSSATRLSKYVLNTLIHFVSACKPTTLSKECLENLIVEVTDKLADKSVPLQPDGRYITMALNQLVLKILERCDYTTCFTTLVNSLTREMVQSGPLVELHMKCILKLTKQISSPSVNLNASLLLRSVNDFLVEVPQPPPKGSMVLKTVKTVLSELANLHGEAIHGLINFTATPLLSTCIRMMLDRNAPEPEPTPQAEPEPVPAQSEPEVAVEPQPEPAEVPVTPAAEPEPISIKEEPVVYVADNVENAPPAAPKVSTADLVSSLRDQLKSLNGQAPPMPSLVQVARAPMPAPAASSSLGDLRARLANLKKNLASN